MPAPAAAGYHVSAPDQCGYGRTTGWDARYDVDLAFFRMLNLVRDVLGLVMVLDQRPVAAVVGYDLGTPVAARCALLRPDVVQRVVLMSAPFAGPPPLPFKIPGRAPALPAGPDVHAALAALPRRLTPPPGAPTLAARSTDLKESAMMNTAIAPLVGARACRLHA